jgi:serine protease Do
MTDILQQLNHAMAAVVERLQGSLVQISNGRRGVGAGTVWHSDGLIVTNAHVVRHHIPQVTLADGRTLSARVLAIDRHCDLAALAVAAHNLPAAERCAVWPLRPGQWVLALGHPWGVPSAATAGVVIDVGVPPERPRCQGEWIQVSVHVRPGHSGGPLVDAQGHLVGITTMMAGPDVGLAVPLPAITAFVSSVSFSPSL